MRLQYLEADGFAHLGKVRVDFAALPAGLVAICGPNGAGKTLLMELSGPACIYREFPTRSPKALDTLVSGPSATAQVGFVLGDDQYVATIRVKKSGQEASLTCNGKVIVSGKVTEYSAKMIELFGPSDVFYASVFDTQNDYGAFISLNPKARRDIFRYLCDLDYMERLAAKAKARLDRLDIGRFDRLNERLRVLRVARRECAHREAQSQAELKDLRQRLAAARKAWEQVARVEGLVRLMAAYRRALQEAVEARQRRTRLEAAVRGQIIGPEPDVQYARDRMAEAQKLHSDVQQQRAYAKAHERDVRRCAEDLEHHRRAQEVLRRVPCRGEGQYARCEFLLDAIQASKEIPKIANRLNELQQRMESMLAEIRQAEQELPDLDKVRKVLAQVEREQAAWMDRRREIQRQRDALQYAKEDEKRAIERARELKQHLPDNFDESLLPSSEKIASIKSDMERCEEETAALERQVASLQGKLQAYDEQIDSVRQELEEARRAVQEREPLEFLVRALGPRGIQSYEIEMSAPRVVELANDLLQHSFGDRFQLVLVMSRSKKSGTGTKDDFAVDVYDSERGGQRQLANLSGGERRIVDEALRTALSLYAAERMSVACETMWRDEGSLELDSDNRAHYISMLLRAGQIGGYRHILLATHDVALAEYCGSVVSIGDGGVTVT